MTARSKIEQSGTTPPETLGDILFSDQSTPPPESEWVALVRSIAARDQSALHALFQRTHRIVFTLTMRITGNPQTAEELTLDVFHDVWRRAPDYDAANGPVVGWVMNMARSRAIDRLRFEQRKKRVDPHRHAPDAASEPAESGPHEVLALQEQEELLRHALAKLTADERRAIEMAFFSGLSHAETAARLGLPLGTVKSRIRTGLGKLRQALMEGWAR
ncbi:MAG TPA: sigma-70 family RNA polymerase sigma factor [Polyangiaceae bacterium]